jgi:Xaa-Pro aminopeptidase
VKSVGIEENRITLAELEHFKKLSPAITFVPCDGTIEAQRAIKDASEIERIQEAVRAAERAFRMFTATLRETDTEKDMVDGLEGYVRRSGARWTSFPPIAAVGERGALPHAPPTHKRLDEGSKLLIDWGADLLYKSDVTRTIRNPFSSAPTKLKNDERGKYDFEELYAIVLKAQSAAIAAIHPGVKASEVDAAARKVFASSKLKKHPGVKLGDFFTHGLGHGLGEAPRVRSNSTDVLEAGMVITIEPGIYLPEWGGIRIEDDVLITPDGTRLLTTLPRELNLVEAYCVG